MKMICLNNIDCGKMYINIDCIEAVYYDFRHQRTTINVVGDLDSFYEVSESVEEVLQLLQVSA